MVTVKALGMITFQGHRFKLSSPLRGHPVAIRPCPETDGLFDIYFAHHKLLRINLHQKPPSTP